MVYPTGIFAAKNYGQAKVCHASEPQNYFLSSEAMPYVAILL
jgi:hypothetical protein